MSQVLVSNYKRVTKTMKEVRNKLYKGGWTRYVFYKEKKRFPNKDAAAELGMKEAEGTFSSIVHENSWTI